MHYLEFSSCYAEMIYLIEQQIYFVLKIHRLDHSIVETRLSFQRGNKSDQKKKEIESRLWFKKKQRTGNIYKDRVCNTGHLSTAVTEVNVDSVQQVIQQRIIWP